MTIIDRFDASVWHALHTESIPNLKSKVTVKNSTAEYSAEMCSFCTAIHIPQTLTKY